MVLEKIYPEDQAIILTTYQTLTNDYEILNNCDIDWDCMIFDEGHLLKDNSIKRTQQISEIKCNVRFLLTGTPLQV